MINAIFIHNVFVRFESWFLAGYVRLCVIMFLFVPYDDDDD